MPFSWLKSYFGPSTLVTAAFIGPGTITVCTLAGANYGYTLLWALLFSVLATVFLQEMSARLGLITQSGFGEAIREGISYPPLKWAAILLVLSAIGMGNAAYEAGNISGAVLGLNELFGFSFSGTVNGWAIGIGSLAGMILFVGSYKTLERVLIGAVGVMSLVFVGMAILVKPDIQRVLQGLLIPTLSPSSMLTALALVGTTVVPYNLFLHATAVQQRYHEPGQLSALRKENVTAILLGGVISMGVVITSAAAFFGSDMNIASAADMASQLEPVLGSFAPTFLGLGLCAAGLTSAITAPLAAAYAVRGVLGWDAQKDKRKFMAV
ncbi:MAG: Nramp family divalent metal transporter, partial [Bacteroidota bacterium]